MRFKINGRVFEAKDITPDSRKVTSGVAFIAYKGVSADGHRFICQAVAAGAKVIIGEYPEGKVRRMCPLMGEDTLYIRVENGREAWALLEAQKYGNPQDKLTIIGVTGTDGKTTTTTMAYSILKHAGFNAGLISTVKVEYGNNVSDTGLHVTSPPPDILYKILAQMVKNNVTHVAMEISSHGLLQRRAFGVHLKVAGVTNVTHEHFDIHGTYEKLIKDKALIFDMTDTAVFVKGAPGIEDIYKEAEKRKNLKIVFTDTSELPIRKLGKKFFNKFPGEYNLQNAALAYRMALELGISPDDAVRGLLNAPTPTGRFQRIPNSLGINIIIDFAHTPRGLESILKGTRKLRKRGEKIITVFGAAGERDQYKRPLMGQVASRLADMVIITAEDPRFEDPQEIAFQIMEGAPDFHFIVELDRKKAIEKAIKLAKPGDWVLILGKGHEKSMNYGGVEIPWNDIEATKDILREMGALEETSKQI